jgi:hypothetical protein
VLTRKAFLQLVFLYLVSLPAWSQQSIDLLRVGYSKLPEKCIYIPDKDARSHLSDDLHSHLLFVSSSELAVYYTRADDCRAIQNNKTLHALFMNSDSGQLLKHRTWAVKTRRDLFPQIDGEGTLFALEGNRYGVIANSKITVETVDGRLMEFPPITFDSFMGAVSVGRNGTTFVLRESTESGAVAYRRFGMRGEELTSRKLPNFLGRIESGRNFVIGVMPISLTLSSLSIFRDTGEDTYLPRDQSSSWTLLNDREYVQVGPHKLAVVSIAPHSPRLQIAFPDASSFKVRSLSASLDGSTFLVQGKALTKVKFQNETLSKGTNVLVFRTTDSALMFHRHFADPRWDWVCSLSPDGKELAVLVDTNVQVFRVDSAR